MKITIAVYGRFHAFYLAEQLQKRECLDRLISTYPTFEVLKYGIEKHYISSLIHVELLSRVAYRAPQWISKNFNWKLWLAEEFDRSVANCLTSHTDIFIGWSGYCFSSLCKAKSLGAISVIERCNSHIEFQTEILQEEFERFGQKFTDTPRGIQELEMQSYMDADYITIPSQYVKETFIQKGIPEDKLIHVPYGTSIDKFYQMPKEDNVFRVIFCGGISIRKGVPYLIQAFYELNLPDAELWLVGLILPELEPIIKKYQSDRIIFKGKQPNQSLKWFYSQCSVFCLPSIDEGLAYVQAEAMACGLPVIHTTNTGGGDIVRNGMDGFCIPIRDVNAIKEKILFFYENPEKTQEMSRSALLQAKQSLSWDDYGEKIYNEYLKLPHQH